MNKIIIFVFFMFLSTGNVLCLENNIVNMCTDDNSWFPFTFPDKEISKGIHVDIVSKALSLNNLKSSFFPMPWKRCLLSAKFGEIDAVVTASYNDERSMFLYYPPDAAKSNKSMWRVMQVEYVVVTLKDNPYEYDGNPKNLPLPVRASIGYSVVSDLQKYGLKIDTAKGGKNNIKKLIRDREGCVITFPLIAQVFNNSGRFKGILKIHNKPYASKSYHLAISKKSKILDKESIRKKIWDQIQSLREKNDFMLDIYEKY